MNQNDIPGYPYNLNFNAKIMVSLTFLEKKVRISIGKNDLIPYSNFKKIEISSGQRVVQIKLDMEYTMDT